MTFHYFIWSLLPIALFFIAAKAGTKKVTKGEGREFPVDYLKQAVYCTVFLVIAIVIDKTILEDLLAQIPLAEADPRVFQWLLYYAILLAAASVQQFFDKRKENRERDAMRARQMKYLQK